MGRTIFIGPPIQRMLAISVLDEVSIS